MCIFSAMYGKASESFNETWGHLAPTPGVKYPGFIYFTWDSAGDPVVLDYDFLGLPYSPWFHDDFNEFVQENAYASGKILRFVGTYVRFKNGNHRFSGSVSVAFELPNLREPDVPA